MTGGETMSAKELFSQDLVFEENVQTIDELFKNVANRIKKQNLVTNDYERALIKRESEFPTGLLTQYLPIALPHTDSIYIKKPFVVVVRNEYPITVKQMGDNKEIEVKDFFFLGVKESAGFSQVELLSVLMDLFMNEKFVNEYINLTNAIEIINCIKDNIK